MVSHGRFSCSYSALSFHGIHPTCHLYFLDIRTEKLQGACGIYNSFSILSALFYGEIRESDWFSHHPPFSKRQRTHASFETEHFKILKIVALILCGNPLECILNIDHFLGNSQTLFCLCHIISHLEAYNLGQNKMRNKTTPSPESMMNSRSNQSAPFFPSLKWGEGWS